MPSEEFTFAPGQPAGNRTGRQTVVVLRALGLGDLLAGVPALRAIRRAFPAERIVLAAPEGLREVVGAIDAVDELFPAAAPGRGVPSLRHWSGPPPDVAVDLHGKGPASRQVLAELAPRRLLAFAGPHPAGEPAPVWRPDEHERERWCRFLAAYGIPADPADLRLPPPSRPSPAPGAVVVHPGANAAARRWPAERYTEVVRALRADGHRVVVSGGPGDEEAVAEVAARAGLGPGDAALGAPFAEFAALVAHAAAFLSADTGPAHLAVAYGTPSVTLFGPVDPRLWGPPPGRRHLSPWHPGPPGNPNAAAPDPLLLRIDPADVLAALRTMPSSPPRTRRRAISDETRRSRRAGPAAVSGALEAPGSAGSPGAEPPAPRTPNAMAARTATPGTAPRGVADSSQYEQSEHEPAPCDARHRTLDARHRTPRADRPPIPFGTLPEEARPAPEAGGVAADPGRGPGPGAVTVAVITRNRRVSLLRTLDHLAALPERPPVIVVDNGSEDGTAEAVRGHPGGARLVSPGANTGALGRNLAVRYAETPYVAFSDDDSWWAPGALGGAAGLLDAHPRLGLLAARTVVGPEAAEDPLNARLAGSPLPPVPGLPGTPVLGFLACACVVRRTAFLDAGGFHPLLFLGGEETLLAYDLAARGCAVCYEPRVVAHHHPAPGDRPGRPSAVRRNALLTAWLRRPLPVAVRHTARLTADATRGEPGAAAALRGTVARMPGVLRQRRRLPPAVEVAARLLDGERPDRPRDNG